MNGKCSSDRLSVPVTRRVSPAPDGGVALLWSSARWMCAAPWTRSGPTLGTCGRPSPRARARQTRRRLGVPLAVSSALAVSGSSPRRGPWPQKEAVHRLLDDGAESPTPLFAE